MKDSSYFTKIYIYSAKVDFRKWIDGLCALIQYEMKLSLLEPGSAFIFLSRCRTKIKIVYWDLTGFVVWYKRLEGQKFSKIRFESTHVLILSKDLDLMLDGCNISQIKRHKKIENIVIC